MMRQQSNAREWVIRFIPYRHNANKKRSKIKHIELIIRSPRIRDAINKAYREFFYRYRTGGYFISACYAKSKYKLIRRLS